MSIAFSPDGGRLATAGDDGAIRLWDAATGREIFAFRDQSVRVRSVVFSPDGRRLAIAQSDGKIRLWDASPTDDATRVRREAVGLVRFALRGAGSEPELRRRITREGAVSDEVRSLALEQARTFWRAHIRAKAQAINESLFSRLLLREDVLAALRADDSLIPDIRAEALSQAANWSQWVGDLSDASRAIADEPGRRADEYQRAMRLAEAACRSSRGFSSLFSLGIAQYRAGYSREALVSFEQAIQHYRQELLTHRFSESLFYFDSDGSPQDTRARKDGPLSGAALPPDLLAYQAMAYHLSGATREARAGLERLRNHYRASLILGEGAEAVAEHSPSGYAHRHRARLKEAEAIVLGLPSDLPPDVFNP